MESFNNSNGDGNMTSATRTLVAALGGAWLAATGCGGGGGSGTSTGPSATLSISLPATSLASGTSAQATANIVSASGSTPATDVHWSSSNSDVATISSTGLITGNVRGITAISATSGALTTAVTVTVTPGAPATVTIYSGDAQSGVKGSVLPDPLCTNVKDAAGNLIIGAVVTYVVASGGGSLAEPTAPPTNAAGISTSGLWTLGSSRGTQTVTASSPGATPVTFTATAQ